MDVDGEMLSEDDGRIRDAIPVQAAPDPELRSFRVIGVNHSIGIGVERLQHINLTCYPNSDRRSAFL